jgi:hypothetical protein
VVRGGRVSPGDDSVDWRRVELDALARGAWRRGDQGKS